MHSHPHKDKIVTGLKKASTVLKKVIEMMERDAYAVDVMQQNLAAMGLLKAAHQSLLEGHVNDCVRTAFSLKGMGRKQQMIDEIMRVSSLSK